MPVDQVTAEILQSAFNNDDGSTGGNIPPLPTSVGDGTYSAAQTGDNPYSTYAIDTTYHLETGLDVLATGNNNGTQVPGTVIRMHQGIMTKTVVFEMEREGAMPDIPQSNTQNPNEVLISADVKTANPLLKGTGKYVFHVGGKYVYKLQVWIDQTKSRFPMGTTPAETASTYDTFHNITPQNFSPNLIRTDYTSGDVSVPLQAAQ